MGKHKISSKSISQKKLMVLNKSLGNINRKVTSEFSQLDDNSFNPRKFFNYLSYNDNNSIYSNDSANKNLVNYNENYHYSNESNNNKNEYSLDNNKNKVIAISKIECNFCGKIFKRKDNLKRHVFYQHSSYKGTNCIYCGKNIIRIKDHIRLCRLKFENESSFNRNIKRKSTFFRNITNNTIINSKKFKLSKSVSKIKSRLLIRLNSNEYKEFSEFKLYTDFCIGKGGQKKVFFGKDIKSEQDLAIKINIKNDNNKSICNEIEILNNLGDINGIPKIFHTKNENNEFIITENLFGPSLDKIIDSNLINFDISLICIIGINLIKILKEIHNKGFIHNDIKPDNICWGRFDFGRYNHLGSFFLTDFGYARNYLVYNKNDGIKNLNEKDKLIHYTDSQEKKFQGTPCYMSIPVSKGYKPSRRTDLEELFYTILFLIKKELPWSNIKEESHLIKCQKMCEIKEKLIENGYFNNIYPEMIYIYKNIRKLEFDEKPDYELYIILLENILRKINFDTKKSKEFLVMEKMNELLEAEKLQLKNLKNSKSSNSCFEGYPIKI